MARPNAPDRFNEEKATYVVRGEGEGADKPDLERGAAMWEALLKEGLYVNLARPPATPANMTLLRCSLCAEHSAEQVQTIVGMFERAGKAVGII